MTNASRRITAVLFSFGFVCMAFCLRFAFINMAPSTAPYVVLSEFLGLVGMGWAVVKAWQSTDAFTDKEKRTFAALYCLYLVINLLTAPVQLQIITTALSTINTGLAASTPLCWTMQGIKLGLPAAGVLTAFYTPKAAAGPENTEQEEASDLPHEQAEETGEKD